MQLTTIENKKAVLYLRVSSEEQVENFSLDTQEEICRREASRRGFEIVEIFREEGKSAKTILGRPELLKLLDFCRRNRGFVDAVFVYRLDRLSRQTQDYLTIRKKLFDNGIELISANEPTGNSPTEKLLETIMASFAQHDNDVRSERTRNGMRARFLSGLPTGNAPLGYVLDHGHAKKDGENFTKMSKAWDLVASGTKSLSEMATIMNEWGLRTIVSGKEYKLRKQTVDRLFRCKFYMGVLTSRKYPEEPKGQHIPMVTQEQFYKVQAILDGRNRSGMTIGKRLKDHPDFPLRRIIKCSKCGSPLSGGWSKGRSKKYAYYVCKSRCGSPSIAVKKLDESLLAFLRKITPPREKLELFLFVLRRDYTRNITLLQAKKDKAEEEIAKLRELHSDLVFNHLKKLYTDEVYQEESKKIQRNITNLEVILGKNIATKYNIDDVEKFMRDKFSDLAKTYHEEKDFGVRRVLLGSICPNGVNLADSSLANPQFSPEYQAIHNIQSNTVALSTPGGT